MKFIVTWTIPKAYVLSAQARFLQTGGAPPSGVKMIGRWHGMNGGGVVIAETDDAKALYTWLEQWNDFLEFTTTPCLDDAEAGAVLSAVKR
jgi:hypothetical protein